MNDSHVLAVLREMAWQRAKGELLSILEAYWYEEDDFKKISEMIEEFIEKIENDSPLA